MKAFFFIVLLITILLQGSSSPAAPAPVQSKENIEFLSKSEQPLVDLMKTSDYRGVIVRTDQRRSDLRHVDFYGFQNIEEISIDQKLCEKLLEKIYGPLKKISLKVQKIEIYKSHTGSTCEAQVLNPDSKSKIPERRTIVGFIKAKPYALVFKFSKLSQAEEQENVRKFWDSLH